MHGSRCAGCYFGLAPREAARPFPRARSETVAAARVRSPECRRAMPRTCTRVACRVRRSRGDHRSAVWQARAHAGTCHISYRATSYYRCAGPSHSTSTTPPSPAPQPDSVRQTSPSSAAVHACSRRRLEYACGIIRRCKTVVHCWHARLADGPTRLIAPNFGARRTIPPSADSASPAQAVRSVHEL